MLKKRLEELGSYYGALPAHVNIDIYISNHNSWMIMFIYRMDCGKALRRRQEAYCRAYALNIWSMVQDNTQRVALIEDNVPEARGLDMMPTTVSRLRSGGDSVTANLLEVIHQVLFCFVLFQRYLHFYRIMPSFHQRMMLARTKSRMLLPA